MSGRAATGAAMIVATSAAIQISAAIAHDLFGTLGPSGVSALRFALGAVVIVAAVRPRLRGRDRATWIAIGAYGISLAALNLTFFEAIQRLPMGIAVTFAFVAPVGMALAGSRRRRDVGYAVLAGAGVVTLGGVDPPGSTVGVSFALATGAAWAGVAYAGRSVGRRTRRVDGLALAIPVAALVTLPLGLERIGAIDPRALGLGLVIAIGGLILPFALELEGLRRLEPRIVAVIYSVDPAIAALVGLIALSQDLHPAQVAGMIAVVAASAGATRGVAYSVGVANLIDSGWAAWLPFELVAALEARDGKSAERRAFRKRLERGPSEEDRERWERFALVCPSRIDLPAEDDLDEQEAYRVLDDLGLLAAEPESVELVLTLDHDDVRELERIRAARDVGPVGAVPAGLPELGNVLGGGKTGRNDPCPCGSGKKFKRCHGG